MFLNFLLSQGANENCRLATGQKPFDLISSDLLLPYKDDLVYFTKSEQRYQGVTATSEQDQDEAA